MPAFAGMTELWTFYEFVNFTTDNSQLTTDHCFSSSKHTFQYLIDQLRVGLTLGFFHDLADEKAQ